MRFPSVAGREDFAALPFYALSPKKETFLPDQREAP
jgi:hypothetical protein